MLQGCWTEVRGQYGDLGCDSPLALVDSAVRFLMEQSEERGVEFVVWTGDDTAHANQSVFSQQEVKTLCFLPENIVVQILDTIHAISSRIGSVGLPVYPVLGNHDIIPKNQFPTPDGDSQPGWPEYYEQVGRENGFNALELRAQPRHGAGC